MKQFAQRVFREELFKKKLGFANKISITRILLIPVFVSSLFYCTDDRLYMRWVAFGIFSLAMLTDFMDGLVARVRQERTRIGTVLDPLADKLLLLNAFIWLYHLRGSLPLLYQIPLWVMLIVVSRDIIILLGIAICYFLEIEITITPTVWGKLTTLSQMSSVVAVLADMPITPILWQMVGILTLISGIDYITRGVRVLNAVDNRGTA